MAREPQALAVGRDRHMAREPQALAVGRDRHMAREPQALAVGRDRHMAREPQALAVGRDRHMAREPQALAVGRDRQQRGRLASQVDFDPTVNDSDRDRSCVAARLVFIDVDTIAQSKSPVVNPTADHVPFEIAAR